MVTQPLEKPVSETPMAKVTTTQASATDTLITLKKSGKVLMLPKGLSSKQIDKLDKFLSQNKTPAATASLIRPNAEMCGWHTTYAWEGENQYQAVPGKYLGIWTNDISSYKAYNQYGFSSIYVNNITEIDSAKNDGFSYDRMMWGLSLNYANEINNSISGGRHVGSYYIDEPIERGSGGGGWTPTLILDASSLTSYPIFLASYKWPIVPQYYDIQTNTTYGQIYGPLINSANNLYIMSDQYYGDCFGRTTYYWSEFWNYYGHNKDISNFMHVVVNQGNIPNKCLGGTYNASSFTDLFNQANLESLNEIWLYAQDTGDENAINMFCNAAWEFGWLYQKRRQIAFVWQCTYPNPCTSCIWGSTDISMWNVVSWHYTGVEQYFAY